MWLSDRRTFLLSLAALAGCGFEPVYGPGGDAAGLRSQIEVDAPTDEDGFNFVRRLEHRLGQPQAPRYQLGYTLRTDEDDLGITPDQQITRYNVLGQVDFTVTDVTTDSVVTSGTIENFTSYAATGTTVSTRAAQRDANQRLMVILADQVVSRLLATSGTWTR